MCSFIIASKTRVPSLWSTCRGAEHFARPYPAALPVRVLGRKNCCRVIIQLARCPWGACPACPSRKRAAPGRRRFVVRHRHLWPQSNLAIPASRIIPEVAAYRLIRRPSQSGQVILTVGCPSDSSTASTSGRAVLARTVRRHTDRFLGGGKQQQHRKKSSPRVKTPKCGSGYLQRRPPEGPKHRGLQSAGPPPPPPWVLSRALPRRVPPPPGLPERESVCDTAA